MAWDDPYDSGLISSIDPRIQSNPFIDEAAGLRIQNQYLDQQRRQQGGGQEQSGKGSWYSQLPEHGWIDRQDKPGSNALGVPDSQQGIALPSKSTLGQWFDVTAPNGETFRLQQTDVGPSTRTGRGIDISAAAAHQMGYTPKDFPTDGGFSWKPANGPPSGAEVAATGSPPDTRNYGSVAAGRPNMNDDNQAQPPGLMQSLFGGLFGGGQQQGGAGGVGGLIGAIDPQKMAYLAMIAKGLDPYSKIDPTEMLKNAQLQQQHQQELAQRASQNTNDLSLRTRHQQFLEDQAAKDKFKLQDFGTDPLSGQRDIRLINPQTGEQKPLQGSMGQGQDSSGPGQGIGGLGKVPENYNDKGKDEDFLKAVEQQYGGVVAKSVQDVVEGRVPATGRRLQQLIPLASRYDQNFTGMQDYQTRMQAAKSFAPGGKDAETVKSYNQAITHANTIFELIPKIEGANVGGMAGRIINTPYGEIRAATDPQYASDRKRYENVVNALSGELMKASRGGGTGSLDEIRHWREGAMAANSGAEMRGAMRGAMDFLHGAMEASARKKSEGMKSQFEPTDLLSGQNKAIFDRIQSSDEKGSPIGGAPNGGGGGGGGPANNQPPTPTERKVLGGKGYSKIDGQWYAD